MRTDEAMMWQDIEKKPLSLTELIEDGLAYFRKKHGAPGRIEICLKCSFPEYITVPVMYSPYIADTSMIYIYPAAHGVHTTQSAKAVVNTTQKQKTTQAVNVVQEKSYLDDEEI